LFCINENANAASRVISPKDIEKRSQKSIFSNPGVQVPNSPPEADYPRIKRYFILLPKLLKLNKIFFLLPHLASFGISISLILLRKDSS